MDEARRASERVRAGTLREKRVKEEGKVKAGTRENMRREKRVHTVWCFFGR